MADPVEEAPRDCGCVVVVDDLGHPLGMVTDRDICMAALRTERALTRIAVADAMTERPFACRPDDTVDAAENLMALHQVRRLPVLDDQGRVCGILALDDIARHARASDDLFAPAVSCAAVGRTLGQITRPHLIQE